MNNKSFSDSLLIWFKDNKRAMPWRENKFFYNIWLSEIMLQQTQVKTVIPYYNRWIKKFSTIKSVANADEDTILKYWEGLGYYARARNFKKACKYIFLNNININNITFSEFLSYPGVGTYTASAVFSIAKNQVYHVVDGNIKRVLSRVLRFKKNPNFHLKQIDSFLLKNISKKTPGDFNQALMELGATICRPHKAECKVCPINKFCKGYLYNDYLEYPVKIKKKKKPHYNVVVGIIWDNDKIIITKRKSKGLLGGLWEFPGGKIENKETPEECIKREVLEEINIKIDVLNYLGQIKHEYSHFSITLNSYECKYKSGSIEAIECTDFKKIKLTELSKYAFPKANHKIFKMLNNNYS